MKEMNKWQKAAAKQNAKLVASGELTRIADRAIAAARKAINDGGHTCNGREMMQSDCPITRNIGQQLDGFKIEAREWALSEIRSAGQRIGKIGNGCPESLIEIAKLNAAEVELGLN